MKTVSKIIKLRPLTLADVPFAMTLKDQVHWNQLETDWKFLIDTNMGGNFLALYNDQKAGTVTTITYQDKISWIGMVLVDAAYRGMGIGTTLLQAAINFALHKGTVRLDATPQGKGLYENLGFKAERSLLRLERKNIVLAPTEHRCSVIAMSELDELEEYDTPVFGARRGDVLRYLMNNSPEYAYCLKTDGRISGYCLGRSGSRFEQIGPLIAEKQDDAMELLTTAMKPCRGKSVIVDTFADNKSWLDYLTSLGFKVQRPLTRMYRGELKYPGIPERQYAIAGPEIG